MLLGLALYVLGLGLGPVLWGPVSELYGRTRPMWVAMAMLCFLQVPWGLARNLEAIFISRFLAGMFGSAPFAILGGTYADCLTPAQQGIAGMLFYAAAFSGPCLGPVLGTYITVGIGWRWTAWISLIQAALFTTIGMLVIPESYYPLLLRWKAERLRRETKDWELHAQSEEESISIETLVSKYLIKPWQMLRCEPVVRLRLPPTMFFPHFQ